MIITGNIDVIDIQTGQIIKSKNPDNACVEKTKAERNTDFCEDDKFDLNYRSNRGRHEKRCQKPYVVPPQIDRGQLGDACLLGSVSAFMKTITPWAEIVYAHFKTDGKIPELEMGANMAKAGRMQEAINIFADAIRASESNPKIKPKSSAKSYWNLGLAYEYTWDFDKAIESFRKAYALHPDEDYLREISKAEGLRYEKKKLEEQGIVGR